ncbi:helix-turn-helix domain-containing protein [Occultella kanbiaonis]|uniref:helix-turn-helix domain-containing protein n=1 Tax=Occultella kanbiaonis TaxID=2675754 RepID=UPI0013D61EF9|nr:helix-turn-helix transcriptional regulator [Occultella kanbiaonis]
MPTATTLRSKYEAQRPRRTPPHVGLGALRAACGLTIDQVIARIREEFPELNPTRGAISAIENGHRGASVQMLTALCAAYGLPSGAITTNYTPREWEAAS